MSSPTIGHGSNHLRRGGSIDTHILPDGPAIISTSSSIEPSVGKCNRMKIIVPYQIHRQSFSLDHDDTISVMACALSDALITSSSCISLPHVDSVGKKKGILKSGPQAGQPTHPKKPTSNRNVDKEVSQPSSPLSKRSYIEPKRSEEIAFGGGRKVIEMRRGSMPCEISTSSSSWDSRIAAKRSSVSTFASVPEQHTLSSDDLVLLRMIYRGRTSASSKNGLKTW
jgi:hypothetical protein